MKKLTASVVGGGGGGQLSMRALEASEHFELVALADTRVAVCDQMREIFPNLKTFLTHRELFAQCPTDVVCVSTYPPSHEEVVIDALRNPLRGILVEKPLGHSVASGRRILEAIQARRLPMAVPHGLLALATPTEIVQRVKRGDIGTLKLVEIQNSGWDIINAGIHWLNFFVTLTGNEPMASVMALCDASARTYRDGMQVETAAVTYAQTQSGVRVVMNTGDSVTVNGAQPSDIMFRIVGSAGIIEFYGWENGYFILNENHPAGEKVTPQPNAISGHRWHLDNMAAQIANDDIEYSIAESSLMALEICEGAYLSSQHRSQVTFPVDQWQAPTNSDWQPGQPYAGYGSGHDIPLSDTSSSEHSS